MEVWKNWKWKLELEVELELEIVIAQLDLGVGGIIPRELYSDLYLAAGIIPNYTRVIYLALDLRYKTQIKTAGFIPGIKLGL